MPLYEFGGFLRINNLIHVFQLIQTSNVSIQNILMNFEPITVSLFVLMKLHKECLRVLHYQDYPPVDHGRTHRPRNKFTENRRIQGF